MNAMSAGNENDADKWGKTCISIASDNLSKDPYWVTQIVVVYIALGNDKIRYKKKSETLAYAHKAVETAIAAQAYFDNEIAGILLAQALMFRGTILYVQQTWPDAYEDFLMCADLYKKQSSIILAIEASRMAGETALKYSQKDKALKILASGVKLGNYIDPESAKASTFSGLLQLLVQQDYFNHISRDEVDKIATNIYGRDWEINLNNWKKEPDANALQRQELEAANA
jgi:hypothetical protein